MIFILDNNVLFSALIKNSLTRKLIYELNHTLLFPEIVLAEVRRNQSALLQKSGLTEHEFDAILGLLLKYITIIPTEQLQPFRTEAWELVKDHSPEDVLFLACVLAFKGSILWSDDKKLKRQTKIKVLSTTEMLYFQKSHS